MSSPCRIPVFLSGSAQYSRKKSDAALIADRALMGAGELVTLQERGKSYAMRTGRDLEDGCGGPTIGAAREDLHNYEGGTRCQTTKR